jgi:cation/acetate symporter
MVFACCTLLVIPLLAALRTRSASDFYTAGGGMTGRTAWRSPAT